MPCAFRCVIPLTIALVVFSCSPARQTVVPSPAEVSDVGLLDRSFMARPENRAYAGTYDTSQIAPEFIGLIGSAGREVDYLVFLGTWCSDSRREVPRFLKIADLAGIPPERIRLYGLDRSKRSPDGMAERYEISRVPTFILLRDGKEEGRIVEMPVTTLEGDLLELLARMQAR